MKVDIRDLIGSLAAIRSPGARVAFPDDPTPVNVADGQRLCAYLDGALDAFRALRGGADYLVSAEVNEYHRTVSVRFVQPGPCQDCNGEVEPELEPAFQALAAALAASRGELHYWGGNNYFDVSLPFRGLVREPFPDVDHLPWDERYRYLLERESWRSLRARVFRFSDLAESFAARCVEYDLSRVLIPSVGLCVHPWLFADRGLSVVATDVAGSALAALSRPDRWPRLYSRAAFERWDVVQSALYATWANPDHFDRMPALEDGSARESLRRRIELVLCDWADLPLADQAVDALFATNALPRESSADQVRVLKEWVRVVRRGGVAFIAQHNFFDADLEGVLQGAGWVEANVLSGERPSQAGATVFQTYYSSG